MAKLLSYVSGACIMMMLGVLAASSAFAKALSPSAQAALQAQQKASLESFEKQEDALRYEAEAGDPVSEYLLGSHLVGQGAYYQEKLDPDEGLQWLDKAINDHSSEAMVEMGYLYFKGKFKPKDKIQALAWFQKAADLGNRDGEYLTCKAYTADADVPVNWTLAQPYCEAAAAAVPPPVIGLNDVRMYSPYGQLNSGALYFELGRAFAEGRLLPKSPSLAVANLNSAITNGCDDAIEYLAFIYFRGEIVPRDYLKSLALFQRDYLNGSATALYILAQHYENGWGTDILPRQAQRFYLAAANLDVVEAQTWLRAHPEVSEANFKKDVIDSESRAPITFGTSADGKTLADYYPDQARSNWVEGSATVECNVNSEGRFDFCLIDSDSNPKYKFGGASIKAMTDLGRLARPAESLSETKGKIVCKTLVWRMP